MVQHVVIGEALLDSLFHRHRHELVLPREYSTLDGIVTCAVIYSSSCALVTMSLELFMD